MSGIDSAALRSSILLCLCSGALAACQTTAEVPSPSPMPAAVAATPQAGPQGLPPASGAIYPGGPSTGYGYGRGPFGLAGSAAPAGFGAAPGLPTWQRTNVSSQQSIGADGSLRTETTRTSVSFDGNRAAAALGGMAGGMGSGSGGAFVGLPGEWRLQADSNRVICSVTLLGSIEASEGPASSSGCSFGAPGQGVTGWRYDGQSLYLLKPGSAPFRMTPVGPNRFDGAASLGFLSVRYALYR